MGYYESGLCTPGLPVYYKTGTALNLNARLLAKANDGTWGMYTRALFGLGPLVRKLDGLEAHLTIEKFSGREATT